MNKDLTAILENSTAGSSELLLLLNNYLSDNIKNTGELHRIIPVIRERFLSFAVINNYLDRIQVFSENEDYAGFLDFTKRTAGESQRKNLTLYKNAKSFIENASTVITISNSTTLLEVFKLWKYDKCNLKVIVAESRPGEEGKIFAEKLLRNSINVQLITEAMMGIYVQMADAVIIGADQILKNGSIVNKTGSKLLAIAAKYYNKPFYIITSKDKKSESLEYAPQEYPPEEIWSFKAANLEIRNYYFETVDRQLITRIITD